MKNNETTEFFIFNGQKIFFAKGDSVLDALLNTGISIDHACGKMGTCGTCRIEILSDPLLAPKRNELELEMALDRNFKDCERQSCQLLAYQGLKIKI